MECYGAGWDLSMGGRDTGVRESLCWTDSHHRERDGVRAYRDWRLDLFVAMAAGTANRDRVGWWARTARR